jgi:toxin ParE1/3/4
VKYWLHPEAGNDLGNAARFYLQQAGAVLAQTFLAEFERTVRLILQHPGAGIRWRNDKRRFMMRRFPFSVIYTVSNDEVRILAIAHHSRRPGFWRGRK